jgi:hypothetical protein
MSEKGYFVGDVGVNVDKQKKPTEEGYEMGITWGQLTQDLINTTEINTPQEQENK